MTDTITSPPPAWYDDPADPTVLRWWSGTEWTAHTTPKQPAMQAHAQQVPPARSAQTRGIWLIAFLPAMTMALAAIAFAALYSIAPMAAVLVAWPVGIGLSWWFGWLDVRELRRRGFRPPPLLWMLLLPPLAYLIARGRMIRAQGGSTQGPEVVFVLAGLISTLIVLGMSVVLSAATGPFSSAGLYAPAADGQEHYAGTYGATGTPTQDSLEQILTTAIAPAGVSHIDCANAIVERGARLTCFGYDASSSYLLNVHICDCGDVFFSYEHFGNGSPQVDEKGAPPDEEAVPGPVGAHGTGNGIVVAQQNEAGYLIDDHEPWVGETERVLSIAGRYPSVWCTAAADVVDLESTFTCQASRVDQTLVDLDVTMDSAGDVSWTEYPLGAAPVRTAASPGDSA